MRRRRRPQVDWHESGRGPALVLLNGWTASGLAWPRAWVRELEQHFRVVRIDNRGSGFSRFAETPFTVSDMADDVARVLDAADLASATVLGMSMGGMIAQEFGVRHGERTDALVLVSTRPPAPAYTAPKETGMLWGLLGSPRRGEALDTYFTRVWSSATGEGFADREPASIEELVTQIVARPTSRHGLANQLRAVLGWGHAERLASITAPTVVVHGDRDRFVDVENGRRIAALIPGSRYVELAGVGHLPPLEAPDALLELLLELRDGPDDDPAYRKKSGVRSSSRVPS